MNNPHLLGTENIGKLLLQYSVPAIISMVIVSLYNIIDSIFIGHGVGPMAIAGLAISFPLMNLLAAFCNLVAAGGAAISSIRLGQKNITEAREVLGTTLMLCIIIACIFGYTSLFFLDNILIFFGASKETLPYARDFMQIMFLGAPITFIMIGLNNIMRATGNPKTAMLTSITTVVCNIIIAPILIFKLGWGIKGAAIATIISQFVGMCWILSHFINPTSQIHLQKGFWRIKKNIIASIFSIGMSPFLMNLTACFVVIFINNSLQEYGGDIAIGAYGIINRLLMLYVMVVLGLTMGMQPIIGYNFGAGSQERVRHTLKLSIKAGVAIMLSGFIICELIPTLVVSMFTDDNALINISAHGLRICVAMFPFVGAQIVIGNFFQSIGKAKISIFLSLTRQLIFLLPGLYFLPKIIGINGVWCALPISDTMAFITAVVALWWYTKKTSNNL